MQLLQVLTTRSRNSYMHRVDREIDYYSRQMIKAGQQWCASFTGSGRVLRSIDIKRLASEISVCWRALARHTDALLMQ